MAIELLSESEAIRNLQTYLRYLSYVDTDLPMPPVDGISGEVTTEAIRRFQEENGLEATGVADRETWDAVYGAYLATLREYAPPLGFSPFPRTPIGYAARIGDVGFLVNCVQYLVNEISILYPASGVLEVSGRYDEATAESVKNIQRRTGIAQTGNVDKTTWDMLVRIYNELWLYSDP